MRSLGLFIVASILWSGMALSNDGGTSPGCCQAVKDCGDQGRCPRCGCAMICKLVPDVKETKRTVWVVKCEPICPMLPSLGRGGDCCASCGAECAAEDLCCSKCGDPCPQCRPHRPPVCRPPKIVKKLEKKEVTCKVPSYKCVPVCGNCGHCGDPKVVACCATCGDAGGQVEKSAGTAEINTRILSAPLPPRSAGGWAIAPSR